MARGLLAPAATCACAFVLACGGGQDDAPGATLSHRVDSAAGYPWVVSAGTAPAWTIEPVLSVGSEARLGEPAPDEFGRITSVVTGEGGTLWVADAVNHRVKAFSADGSLLVEAGREGQGPGEFVALYSLAWVGDRLLALDFGNGRVAELSADGTWLGSRPAPGRISGPVSLLRLYAVSDTTAYQWSLSVSDGDTRRVWVEHGPDGVRGERAQHRVEPPDATGTMCNRPDGAISFFEVPFGGQVLQHPARSGATWVTWTAEYRFTLLDGNGDTLRVVERERDAVPILDAEWDSATADFRDFREEWPSAQCEPAALSRPSAKAAVKNLLVDTSERLWAEVFTAEGTHWEVFDPEGRLIGRVPSFGYADRVTPSIRPPYVAWVSVDSLDVERAHVGRLVTGPPRGSAPR